MTSRTCKSYLRCDVTVSSYWWWDGQCVRGVGNTSASATGISGSWTFRPWTCVSHRSKEEVRLPLQTGCCLSPTQSLLQNLHPCMSTNSPRDHVPCVCFYFEAVAPVCPCVSPSILTQLGVKPGSVLSSLQQSRFITDRRSQPPAPASAATAGKRRLIHPF